MSSSDGDMELHGGGGGGGGPKPLMSKEDTKYTEVTKDKPIRLQVKVLIPVKEHPRYNFVGKLLGPKGNSLKRLQDETMTKMAILGRGSMRDKSKEEELRQQNDPKHAHLNEDLHVEINAFAPPAEAYARLSHALAEIRKFLIPDDNDEIRQTQLQELAYLNGSGPPGAAPGRGRGRGAAPLPPMGGPAAARTARAGLLATPPPLPPGAPRAITSRPGGPPQRPGLPPARGSVGRVPPQQQMVPRVATYRTAVPDNHEDYSYEESYDYQESYDQSDPQYYDYAGASGDAYEGGEYAGGDQYAAEEWQGGGEVPRLKAPGVRPTTRGAFREHPYAPQVPRY